MRKSTGTRMRSFGVSPRINHSSSEFYERELYAEAAAQAAAAAETVVENPLPSELLDQVLCRDSRSLPGIPDCSLHLMVTSPPYNVGKDYDQDLSLADYRALLHDVFKETYRVLAPGGRACVNVANLGRKPYLPLHSLIIKDMQDLGFLMRGEIIWDKSASAGSSTAWGSWQSAANPTLRDVHEYILVFCKGAYKRSGKGRTNTISRDEFLAYTKSIWSFPSESARRVKHPAPFPVELPYRLVQLYTFADDVVFDPFCGSGSSCVAALKAGRHYLGVDVNPAYVAVAEQRIAAFRAQQAPVAPQREDS